MTVIRAQCAGLTLIELLVVLVVVGMLALSARPLIAPPEGLDVRAAATEITATLRHARARAVGDGRETALMVDLDARRYQLPGTKARALPANADVELLVADTEIGGPRTGAFRFFPDGSSTGGSIRLTAGNSQVTITVDWLTGRVRVDEQ